MSLSFHILPCGFIFVTSDAPDGNAYVMFNETDGGFICGSLSDSLYSFDLDTETFTELDTMPKARYRHSAVYVAAGSGEHQLWLIGGRDIDDNVIPDVDVRIWENVA